MKKRFLFSLVFIFFLLIAVQSIAQKPGNDMKYLKYCLSTLASDSMGGRAPGSVYDKKAAAFIAGEFQKLKISPFQKNNYFQEFSYTKDSSTVKTHNIIGIIDNKAHETVIIGAHYDHLGFGGPRSRSFGKHEVHNGADDNASGVALMLTLAYRIKEKQMTHFNFIFISFSGHEDGLYGSDYFVQKNLLADSSLKVMISLDMVGRAESVNPAVFVASNDTCLWQNFKAIADRQKSIRMDSKEMTLGDHTAFINHNVPVLFLTTGMDDDYHKVSDDESLINYKALLSIEKLVLTFLKSIDRMR